MSRFEMSASKPEEIQFELRATMTLGEWLKIKDALKDSPAYGPAYWLWESIVKMTQDASQTYSYYPEEEPK